MDWVRKNYALEVHPGFAFDAAKRNHLRGLFYNCVLMACALDADGENPFVTFDGKAHDWPREMAENYLRRIQESRLWMNDNSAWYEGDPLLVTSYVLLTCDVLFRHLKQVKRGVPAPPRIFPDRASGVGILSAGFQKFVPVFRNAAQFPVSSFQFSAERVRSTSGNW